MFSSLTVKPLLYVIAGLLVTQSLSAWLVVRQYKEIGACKAQCELRVSNESSNRSQATTDAVTKALRDQVTQLQAQLTKAHEVNKASERRMEAGKEVLAEYRRRLDEARKADPSLDQPVDVARLRALEDAYRIRADARRDGQVQRDP